MNKTTASLISNLVFFLNPTLWFSFGLAEISTNSKISYLKMSLFMGVVGFSIFPWGDGYERFKVFSIASEYELIDFIRFGFFQGDVVFYLVSYFVNYLDLSYQYVQFFFVFLGYFVILSQLRFYISGFDQKSRIILFLLVMLLINFIGLANNLRYMLATIFALHAIFLKQDKNSILGCCLFFILAGLTHFYAFFIFTIYIFLSLLSRAANRRNLMYIVFFSILFAFISPVLIKYIASIVSQMDGIIARKFSSYLLGGDGLITKMISSPSQLLNHSLKQAPLILLVYYFLRYGDFNCNKTRLFIFLFCFSLSFSYFFSVYLRLSYFCLLYGLFLFVDSWNIRPYRRNWFYCLFMCSILYFSLNIIYFQRIIDRDNINIVNENTLCLVALPIFFMDECAYDDSEIHMGNNNFRLLKMESIDRTMDVINK
ncbi:EpsG family protein [Vibrio furnissii]|uniref:EpsG family protein n=1 Tax=Vibrio furnissii TaxID=29494 RepID=UPI0013023726|nr:EpsG family protein [Vibrio furnissii]